MKPTRILLIALLFTAALHAADLPTVTIEHLYYLQARAERVRKFKPDEMIEYCTAQKIGGTSFENLYAQLFAMRIELVRLLKVDGVRSDDPRVVTLQVTHAEYSKLLREEVHAVQNGILREGQVATDALSMIAKAQNPQ